MRQDWRVAGAAALGAFGTAGGAMALYGVGVPFGVGAFGLALCAGFVVGTLPRPAPAAAPAPDPTPLQARVQELEAAATSLRHDLRGVLSPALMMSDRLVNHTDPAIRRAGEAVVRSVDRATAMLAATKGPPA